jgi:hypothetical protein
MDPGVDFTFLTTTANTLREPSVPSRGNRADATIIFFLEISNDAGAHTQNTPSAFQSALAL